VDPPAERRSRGCTSIPAGLGGGDETSSEERTYRHVGLTATTRLVPRMTRMWGVVKPRRPPWDRGEKVPTPNCRTVIMATAYPKSALL
jgi:hypothetical protein